MYPSTIHMGAEPFAAGTLTGSTKTIVMAGAPMPCHVDLQSTNTGRKIEISNNGGLTYIEPAPTHSTTTARGLTINAHVTHVRLTGSVGDAYSIL